MASSSDRWPGVRGYTLVEVIVVMAIITSLVALSLPALRTPLSKSELRDAAKQIRNALTRARLEAIESDAPQWFRFQPGTGRFQIVPKATPGSGEGLSFNSAGGYVSRPASSAASATGGSVQDEATLESLPAGVCFYDQDLTVEVSDDLQPTTGVTTQQWSSPIIFYPNGRTSNARIQLRGQRNFLVNLTLRGVTGSVKIGKLVRMEQQP